MMIDMVVRHVCMLVACLPGHARVIWNVFSADMGGNYFSAMLSLSLITLVTIYVHFMINVDDNLTLFW